MSFIDIVAPILEHEDKNVNTATKHAAVKIGGEINTEFRLAIQSFYSAYHPKRGRTASMYQFRQGVGGKNKYYKRMEKNVYKTGLLADPSFYEGNPYQKDHGWTFVDPSYVFNFSYLQGIHGFTEDMVSSHNEFSDKKWNPKNIPPKTTPPDEIMQRSFDDKFTKDYCQSVLNSCYAAL